MYPEDTNEGRQEHNGKNEIYKTAEIEKEFYEYAERDDLENFFTKTVE